jgi:hypothetical protein
MDFSHLITGPTGPRGDHDVERWFGAVGANGPTGPRELCVGPCLTGPQGSHTGPQGVPDDRDYGAVGANGPAGPLLEKRQII